MLETAPAAVLPPATYMQLLYIIMAAFTPHCYGLPPPPMPHLPCSSDPTSSQLLGHSDGSGQQVTTSLIPGSCTWCK